MLRIGDELDLTVERPAVGGPMIARADGGIVLVTGAIPGERVTARIERRARHVAFAATIAVREPSPDRRPPFADPLCGGCSYSHIAYPRQLTIKSEAIADAFARIGRAPLPGPVRVAESPEEGYRMRARLHVDGRRIGFFREGTHVVCDVRQSRQLLPQSCDALDRLADAIRSLGSVVREVELSENLTAGERVVHLNASEPIDRRVLASLTSLDGFTPPPYVTDALTIGGRTMTLRRHVLSFFQGNRFLLADLLAHVAGLVPEGSRVLDLYAGTGLLAIAAAVLRGAMVRAVEIDPHAAEDLRVNAIAAGAAVAAVRADVETFVHDRGAGPNDPAYDVVIVDPPRTGLSRAALDGVLALQPSRLAYVSCDVATLARDTRRIIASGYTMARADAFDLFPNTPHVETVVLFVR